MNKSLQKSTFSHAIVQYLLTKRQYQFNQMIDDQINVLIDESGDSQHLTVEPRVCSEQTEQQPNRCVTGYRFHRLTEGGQSEHAIELPLLGVSDDVSGVTALLRAVEQRPPEVSLTQQAEHTQLPVDLHRGKIQKHTHDVNTHRKKSTVQLCKLNATQL